MRNSQLFFFFVPLRFGRRKSVEYCRSPAENSNHSNSSDVHGLFNFPASCCELAQAPDCESRLHWCELTQLQTPIPQNQFAGAQCLRRQPGRVVPATINQYDMMCFSDWLIT